jgi:hypothetical protein
MIPRCVRTQHTPKNHANQAEKQSLWRGSRDRRLLNDTRGLILMRPESGHGRLGCLARLVSVNERLQAHPYGSEKGLYVRAK